MQLSSIDVIVCSLNFNEFVKTIKHLGILHKRPCLIDHTIEFLYDLLKDRLGTLLLHYGLVKIVDNRKIQLGGISIRLMLGTKRKQPWVKRPKKFITYTLYLRMSELLFIEGTKISYKTNNTNQLYYLGCKMFPMMFNKPFLWTENNDKSQIKGHYRFLPLTCKVKPIARNIIKLTIQSKDYHLFNAINKNTDYWTTSNVHLFIKQLNYHFFKFLNSTELKILAKYVLIFISLSKYEYIVWDGVVEELLNVKNSYFCDLPDPILCRYTFIYWYFKEFLNNILLKYFYMTNSDFYGNKIFFIPKVIWLEWKAKYESLFISTNFVPTDGSDNTLGTTKLRLLPKTKGLRPILNLSNKNDDQKSINDQLKDVFACCSVEFNSRPFGYNDVFSLTSINQLKPFLLKMKSCKLPFIAKIDFESAYDTLDHKTCIALVHELLQQKEYPVIEYFKTFKLTASTWLTKQIRKAFNTTSAEILDNIALFPPSKAFIEPTSTCKYILKSQLINLIETHIMNNIVTINGQNYKQEKGIPQGSILSGLLCTILFQEFLTTINKNNCAVAHFVDDVLFFGSEKKDVVDFLTSIQNPVNTLGLSLNKAKTRTNFKFQNFSSSLETFSWCGLLIELKPFAVKRDLTKYIGREMRYFMSISNISKIVQIFSVHLLSMLYDNDINSEETILINIIQHTILSTFKSVALIKELCKRNQVYEPEELISTFKKACTTCLNLLNTSTIKKYRQKYILYMLNIIYRICKRHGFILDFEIKKLNCRLLDKELVYFIHHFK